MKLKYTGKSDSVTVRGVQFPRGKAVVVSDADLAAKMQAWPDVVEVKSRRKVKADDQDT